MSAPTFKSAQRQRVNKQARDLGYLLAPVRSFVAQHQPVTPAEVVAAFPMQKPKDVRRILRILADDGDLSVIGDSTMTLFALSSMPEEGN